MIEWESRDSYQRFVIDNYVALIEGCVCKVMLYNDECQCCKVDETYIQNPENGKQWCIDTIKKMMKDEVAECNNRMIELESILYSMGG